MIGRNVSTSALVTVVLLSISSAAVGSEWSGRHRLRADLQTTSRLMLGVVPAGRCVDEAGKPPVIGILEVVGAGESNLLGPVVDEQSHCVRADNTFFDGRFTLTNADGRTIRGRYFGALEPTFNSKFPPEVEAPAGPFLIKGQVCISGGTGWRILDACAFGWYEPARGMTNVSTGDATIFLDQMLVVR